MLMAWIYGRDENSSNLIVPTFSWQDTTVLEGARSIFPSISFYPTYHQLRLDNAEGIVQMGCDPVSLHLQ